jgi:hypothetical protein
MVVLDGNFALGCGLPPNTYISMYPRMYPRMSRCNIERILETITYFNQIRANFSVTETHIRITALFGLQVIKCFNSILFTGL